MYSRFPGFIIFSYIWSCFSSYNLVLFIEDYTVQINNLQNKISDGGVLTYQNTKNTHAKHAKKLLRLIIRCCGDQP